MSEPEDRKGLDRIGEGLKKLTLRAVTDGIGPVTGSVSYAQDRLARTASGEDVEAAVTRIIREAVVASGTQGFLTGLGGFATLPITLPANLAGALIINARMVGAIAHLRSYHLDDPHTQAILLATVGGSSLQGELSEIGGEIGKAYAKKAIAAVPMDVIHKVNKAAGIKLVAKYGTKQSKVTLSKLVPGAGGLIGGTLDAAATRALGAAAKRAFPAL